MAGRGADGRCRRVRANESRPGGGGSEGHAAGEDSAVSVPEIAPRKGGVLRVTTVRVVSCTCQTCGRTFASTGTAASHARAVRHRVACDYTAAFTFVPTELAAGDAQ